MLRRRGRPDVAEPPRGWTLEDYIMQSSTRRDMLDSGFITVKEAVALSRIGRSSLYELMRRGELAYTSVGRRRLIPRDILIAVLKRNAVGDIG